MKKITITLLATACFGVMCAAQPRSVGIRAGGTGFDATYQHSTKADQFLEADLGADFGFNANGHAGFKATATYNFIWARPAWTQKGRWGLYAGPGLSIGYVDDQVSHKLGEGIYNFYENGFMLSLAAQVGVEYSFWFPLNIAIDIRPYFGFHINEGNIHDPLTGEIIDRKTGFYDNGLLGFAPTISVKYTF